MRKVVLLDENSNKISEVNYNQISELYTPKSPITSVSNVKYNKLLTLVKYVSILIPYNNGEDFIFKFSDVFLLNLLNLSQDDIKGRSFSEIFPIFKKLGVINFINESYKSGNTQKFKVVYYHNNQVSQIFHHQIIKNNNLLYFFSKNKIDLYNFEKKEDILFNESSQGIIYLNNHKIIKSNPKFSEISGYNNELKDNNVSTKNLNDNLELKNRTDLFSKILPQYLDDLKINLERLLNNEIDFYSVDLEFINSNNEVKWIRIIINIISYKREFLFKVVIEDIDNVKRIQEKARALSNDLEIVQDSCKLAIVNWDSTHGYSWTSEIYNILEMSPDEYSIQDDIFYEFAATDKDREDYLNLKNNIDEINTDFSMILKVKTANKNNKNNNNNQNSSNNDLKNKNLDIINQNDDNLKYLSIFLTYSFHDDEKSFVGYAQDLTDSINREINLNKNLDDKKVLLQEVHHRVKNNLQIILSLLNLELKFNPNDIEETISGTRDRIKTIALIHEKIYESNDLAHVNIKNYIETSVSLLFGMYDIYNVDLNIDVDEFELNMDTTINLGLILNELINNVIKYAFPDGNGGKLNISLKVKDNSLYFIVKDNGVGLPDGLDIYNTSSLGLVVINNLVSQLEGKFSTIDCEGTGFEIIIPNSSNSFI